MVCTNQTKTPKNPGTQTEELFITSMTMAIYIYIYINNYYNICLWFQITGPQNIGAALPLNIVEDRSKKKKGQKLS